MSLNVAVVVENCIHLNKFLLNKIEGPVNLIKSFWWLSIIMVAIRHNFCKLSCWISHSDRSDFVLFVFLVVFLWILFFRLLFLLFRNIFFLLFLLIFFLWLLGCLFRAVGADIIWVRREVSTHASSVIILGTNVISTLPNRWNTVTSYIITFKIWRSHAVVVTSW